MKQFYADQSKRTAAFQHSFSTPTSRQRLSYASNKLQIERTLVEGRLILEQFFTI
jgi:hypothetical protein